MKILGVAIARTGTDLNEPIPLTVANDLSSFGFFQRQVSAQQEAAASAGPGDLVAYCKCARYCALVMEKKSLLQQQLVSFL
jgi:hypothetical protein